MKQLLTSFLLLIFSAVTTADEVDPFEEVNRSIYEFNQALDENIFEPIARTYKDSAPQVVQNRVSDFSDNLNDMITLGNEVLQFEVSDSINTFGRVVVNTTIGLLGLFDVASEIGIQRTKEDFGQTLAVWGAPEGPYVVLPILGPSTLRDTAGVLGDAKLNTELLDELDSDTVLALTLVRALDARTKLLPVTDLLKNSDDPYTTARSSYLQRRQFEVYDGNLPVEEGDEF